MTTYDQLWGDLDFLKKKKKEQEQYMLNYNLRHYNPNGNVERFNEVLRSAQVVLDRVNARIEELEK